MTLTKSILKSAGNASGGSLVTYTGSNPAANTEWSETVPTGCVWRILAIRAQLVTDANVANRRVSVTITDVASGNVVFKPVDESVQAASLTHNYNIAPQQGHAVADVEHYLPLPISDSWFVPAGFVIASSTLNLQATDNWGAPTFYVEEFFSAAP
jgi:hypothetical protein